MKRKHRFIAVLLILIMGMTVFPETVLAVEPNSGNNQTAALEQLETDESKLTMSGEDASGPEQIESDNNGNIPENATGVEKDGNTATGTQEEKNVASEPEPQEEDKDAASEPELQEADEGRNTEEMQAEALSEADLDDPGRGRLSGQEIPADFLGSGIQTRAAATGITHNKKFAGYTMKQGIDVSKWNGTIDWKKVKNAGIEFTFVRTSYRGTLTGNLAKDATGPTNMKNAAAAGVKVGAYIFSQAITTAEAVQEAEYLLQTVKGYNITMPLVFDYEYYSGGRFSSTTKLTARQKTDICLAFCDRIKQAGYTPIVYANMSMFTSDLYASEITAKYSAWLAHYTNSTSYTGDYDFWQYTSTGSVSGISGDVDMNFWYIKPGSTPSYGTGSTVSSTNSSSSSNTTTSISTAAPAAPATPKLTGKASSYDKVVLSWKKISGATGYILYRYDSSKKAYARLKVITSSSTVSYTDTGRTLATTYKYKIKAYTKANGKTAYSSASSAVSVKTAATMTGKTNGTSINVRSGPGVSKKILTRLGINTGVIITGISGSWYRVSIKIKGKSTTGYINKAYMTIIRMPTLSVSASSKTAVKLTWDKISGASGYVIQRYNSTQKKYVTVKTITSGSTVSYTNSGLKSNTTYKYRIRSYTTVRGKKIYSYYCSGKSVKTNK